MHFTKLLTNVSHSYKPLRSSLKKLFNQRRSFAKRAYIHQVGQEALSYRNLGQQLQRAVEKFGKRTAIISCHEGTKLTFEEAKNEAQILAVKLQALDMKVGDHVGIWAPNTVQWYISWLAAAMGGFPLVCINPALQAQEVEYALRKAKVKTLITMDECGKQNFCEILKKVLPNLKDGTDRIDSETLPSLRSILVKTDKVRGEFLNYDQVLQTPTRSKDVAYLNYKLPEISPESPCNIQFTSGTTGVPKAALLTHFNWVNVGHYFGIGIGVNDGYKILCLPTPMFHAIALGCLVSGLEYGTTLVLPSPTFNSVATLEAIEKEGCTNVIGTPTMYVDMLEQQIKLKKSMKSLELAVVGGAACSPEVHNKVKGVFGLKEMRIGYGQSESTTGIMLQDGSEERHNAALTVGKLFEHGEAKVINDKGETVALGEAGELCVRGFFTMNGYFEDEESTRKALTVDGWLKTGDEFILELGGYFRIIGRKKDMIIRGGENLFPKEIEDFLDTHEQVLESQVIGVPDKRMGEEVCAFLRLRPGTAKLTEGDVKNFCKGNLAHFKIPRYVRFVDEFPKTNSGKVQKFKLRELFKEK